jgi:hypothetical protein
MDIDTHDVKSECDMKIAPFKRVLWLVERGASCMKIVPFEEYFGRWMERGARCACHARQERTNIDVYGNKHKPSRLKSLVYRFCDFQRK